MKNKENISLNGYKLMLIFKKYIFWLMIMKDMYRKLKGNINIFIIYNVEKSC